MAENKKGFILYADLIHTVSKLPREVKGDLFQLILDFVNDKNPSTEDLLLSIAFEPIKLQLKRDLKHWESIKIKRSDAGKASANKRQQVSTSVESVEQNSTKPTVIVTVNDKVKEIVSSEKWIEEIAITYKFKNQFVKTFLNEFLSTQKLMPDFERKPMDEIKKHFVNSIRKIEPPKKETAKW